MRNSHTVIDVCACIPIKKLTKFLTEVAKVFRDVLQKIIIKYSFTLPQWLIKTCEGI